MQYSLLHCHFESALRAISVAKPEHLHRLRTVPVSNAYRNAAPDGRLAMLWETVLRLADGADIFSEDVFRRVVRGLLMEMTASHIEHVDLRVGPSVGRWRWMRSAADGIAVFRDELARCPGLSMAFLAGINMTKSTGELDAIFDILVGAGDVSQHIAGVDINFLPDDLPKFDRYLDALRGLQRSGLKVNVHLGELFSNQISRYVFARIVPDRVGHGVLLLDDPMLVDLIRTAGICLDMCPTSNTTLGVVDWRRDNPARRALDLGVPVSINTDDPILFETTLAQEIRLSGLSDTEIDTVVAYSRKHRYDTT